MVSGVCCHPSLRLDTQDVFDSLAVDRAGHHILEYTI
jgi:hypothetical protein